MPVPPSQGSPRKIIPHAGRPTAFFLELDGSARVETGVLILRFDVTPAGRSDKTSLLPRTIEVTIMSNEAEQACPEVHPAPGARPSLVSMS